MQLILASSSPRRQQILQDLGLQFQVVAPRPEAEKPLPRHLPLGRLRQMLPEISESKAADVAGRCSQAALVVAADTVVYAQGQVLGKPGGALVARRYLQMLSGRNHRVLTSVTAICSQTGRMQTAIETTEVRFRALSDQDISRYIATGEPLDKAGAYGIQGWGGLLVESLKGRYDNVVGFPMLTLENLMSGLGKSLFEFVDSPC